MTELATLDIQAPLPQQRPMFDAPHRFIVARCGRRWGKTRACWIASMVGRGPGWEDFTPQWEGVLQGWDVVWLAPDYPQAKSIWLEDVKPRGDNLDGVKLNNTDFTLAVDGGGTLHVRSAEAIKSLRGLGARLKGVIIDEAAWMDLESHWLGVIRPILMDNQGWAIIASTSNAGLDGNTEHRAPSFFNRLCQEVADGTRDPSEWVEFYGTAQDNPLISPAEFASMVKEYPPESVQLGQEVYAKLLATGAGLAFPEWLESHHKVRYEPPPGWAYFAAMDWGYSDHCAVLFFAAGPKKDVLVRSEIYVNKRTPYDVGFEVGEHAKRYPKLEYLVAGSDMWDVRDGGETIAEKFQTGLWASTLADPIPFVSFARGRGTREAGKMTVHEFLKYEAAPDGTIPPWSGAKLRVHADCVNLLRTLPSRPLDPHNSEDVEEGGEDHPYDALRYGLASRFPRPEDHDWRSVPDDVHPGWDLARRRRKPRWEREPDEESIRIEQIRQGRFVTGVRYGGARPVEE